MDENSSEEFNKLFDNPENQPPMIIVDETSATKLRFTIFYALILFIGIPGNFWASIKTFLATMEKIRYEPGKIGIFIDSKRNHTFYNVYFSEYANLRKTVD